MSIVPSDRDKGQNETFEALRPALVENYVGLARLCAVLNLDGLLSEGQLARIIERDRVAVRQLIDDGRTYLADSQVSGDWGTALMARIAP